ncbi:MAG: HAD family hydrolase [Gemmobacter sp.]
MTWAAVIFDLDGTLLDTEAITHRAAVAAFGVCGVAVDPAFLLQLVGVDDVTGAGRIMAAYPGLDLGAFEREWKAASIRGLAGGIALKPGVMELLGALDLPMAIATSSTRVQATRKFAACALPPFAHVVTVDDVARAKPAPDPYLRAAALLGVDPARCLAFEDSETGARSAHAAGMTVVQVPDLLPASGDWAHHVADDILTGARMAGLIAG